MLSKKNRASTREIDEIFKEGRSLSSPSLSFRYFKIDKEAKISFIVPKSVARLAVKRNLLRRRGYAVLRILEKNSEGLPHIAGAFIFKKYQEDVSILENEVKNILSKVN